MTLPMVEDSGFDEYMQGLYNWSSRPDERWADTQVCNNFFSGKSPHNIFCESHKSWKAGRGLYATSRRMTDRHRSAMWIEVPCFLQLLASDPVRQQQR